VIGEKKKVRNGGKWEGAHDLSEETKLMKGCFYYVLYEGMGRKDQGCVCGGKEDGHAKTGAHRGGKKSTVKSEKKLATRSKTRLHAGKGKIRGRSAHGKCTLVREVSAEDPA